MLGFFGGSIVNFLEAQMLSVAGKEQTGLAGADVVVRVPGSPPLLSQP